MKILCKGNVTLRTINVKRAIFVLIFILIIFLQDLKAGIRWFGKWLTYIFLQERLVQLKEAMIIE
jgi:hypothetical protein